VAEAAGRWLLQGEAQQEAFGRALARACGGHALIYLEGDLGSGKTTLARGVLRGLGHRGPVRSPTYTLLEPYDTATGPAYHLDLYRLGDPEELEYLGLRELLRGPALVLVEWPERGRGWLPPPDLRIRLEHRDGARALRVGAESGRGAEILDRLIREHALIQD